MEKTRFSEAAFIASSAGSFKFQNVEKRDTEKSYVSEWVNSIFGREEEDKKKRINEAIESLGSEEDEIAKKKAFLEEMEYDPERTELLDEVHICDGSENYHFNSKVGDVVLNNEMLEAWQERNSELKEVLEKFNVEFYFDWDEMIAEAQVNGEITFGEFTYNGDTYFGYGYFN